MHALSYNHSNELKVVYTGFLNPNNRCTALHCLTVTEQRFIYGGFTGSAMKADVVSNITQQVCQADVEEVREVYLEAICVLAESSTSFIIKLNATEGSVVRSTLPSLMHVTLPDNVIRLEDEAYAVEGDDLTAWSALPPVKDGRIKSIAVRLFNVSGEAYMACAGHGQEGHYTNDLLEQFNWTAPLGAHTVRLIRHNAKVERERRALSSTIDELKQELASAESMADQLEGTNAQLSNALLEVSSAKAQSKALLLTVGIGIVLFAISEFQIEPWLEASGVSSTTLIYQKVLILGGLVPIQVLVERLISSKVNSNASNIRISMYEEVVNVLLEDGALTIKELRWLELYRRQQGITKEEAQSVEARLRNDLLKKSRQKLQIKGTTAILGA